MSELTNRTSSGSTFQRLGLAAKATTLIELISPSSGPKVARSAGPRVGNAFQHSLIALRYGEPKLPTRWEFNGR
jgi:hypothetical protein